MPDELRTDKRLWRELVGSQLPDLALARHVAIPSLTDCIGDRGVLALLLDELASERSSSVFAPLLRARCCTALRAALRGKPAVSRAGWRPRLRRAVPERLRAAVRHWRTRPRAEPLVLAFRAFVASRMHALLRADAATRPASLEPAANG
jgi:hypothetical protein